MDRRSFSALQSDSTVQIIRPGDTGEDLFGGVIYIKKSKQLYAGTIRAYDAQTDKYSVLFQNFAADAAKKNRASRSFN